MTAPDARRRGAAGAGPARVVHSRRTRLGPRTRAGVRGGRGESICTWLRGGGGSRVGCCSQSGAARYWGDRGKVRCKVRTVTLTLSLNVNLVFSKILNVNLCY